MKTRIAIILPLILTLLFFVSLAFAQGSYNLSWWTVDGGGFTSSTGSGYALGGTIGQPDAGPSMSGGSYTLTGGLWGVGVPSGGAGTISIYLPIVLKRS